MKSIFKTLGASNLTNKDRSEFDYYGTPPEATRKLLELERFSSVIWEPCAGHHLISNELIYYADVRVSDIIDYPPYTHEKIDFLKTTDIWYGDIVTNPPYKFAGEFVKHALDIVADHHKVAMLLRLQFLESKKRYETIFKENPPKTVYVFVKRQFCSKNDDFAGASAVAYAWFVWVKGFTGNTTIKWIY